MLITEKRAQAAAEIQVSPPNHRDIWYLPSPLVRMTLPYSDPGQMPGWSRRDGRLRLLLRPHVDDAGCARYPFGLMPRLLLLHLSTVAVKQKTREIDLEGPLTELMSALALNPLNGSTGSKRGDAGRLLDQFERLMKASLRIEERSMGEEWWWTYHVSAAGHVWERETGAPIRLRGKVLLSENYWSALQEHAVPLDRRILMALRPSLIAIDLYQLLSHRTWRVNRTGIPAYVPWRGLQEQLGSATLCTKQFRKACLKAISHIKIYWPGLEADRVDGALVINPGRLSINPKA